MGGEVLDVFAMSKSSKSQLKIDSGTVEVKSKVRNQGYIIFNGVYSISSRNLWFVFVVQW